MARQISQVAMEAMLKQTMSETFLVTAVLSHPSISSLYFVNDLVDHTIGAQLYKAFPFIAKLPTDDKDKPPRAFISISNVDQSIIDKIRTYGYGFTLILAVRLASQLSTVEYGPWELDVSNIVYDEATIDLELTSKNITIEPFPKVRFVPSYFPGVFS